jgi:hypothetical protein
MELYLHSPYMPLRHIQDNCTFSLDFLYVANSLETKILAQSQEANVNQAQLLYTCCGNSESIYHTQESKN